MDVHHQVLRRLEADRQLVGGRIMPTPIDLSCRMASLTATRTVATRQAFLGFVSAVSISKCGCATTRTI